VQFNSESNNLAGAHASGASVGGRPCVKTLLATYRQQVRTDGRCCICTDQMAALICVKRRQGCHLERMTSYQKSDSVNRRVFAWGTILPNFIPIRLEVMEHWAFLKMVATTRRRTRRV